MLARVIHRISDRGDRPLVPFNCTAVPRDMLESQLFGYRKGAFTSADSPFAGVIRTANGGTLFLDEIGDVAIEIQPKLLRFLEHHEVHPLGEAHAVKVDVRIIAATNANLEQLVAQGRFREDLLYRLKVLPLHLPPLRERREEIPALLQHYLQKHGDEQKKGRVTLSDETLEYLLLYSWPGNIRQLANEVRRIIALAEPDAIVTPSLLSPEILASRRTVPSADAPVEPEIRLRARSAAARRRRRARTDARPPRARKIERSRRRSRAAPRHLEKGIVPEAPALGPAAGVVGRAAAIRVRSVIRHGDPFRHNDALKGGDEERDRQLTWRVRCRNRVTTKRLALNVPCSFVAAARSPSPFRSHPQPAVSQPGQVHTARLLQQHEPDEAHHFGLWKQVDEQPAQADRLAAQFGSCCPRRIALVKDEIDDLKHGAQRSGNSCERAPRTESLSLGSLPWRAQCAAPAYAE